MHRETQIKAFEELDRATLSRTRAVIMDCLERFGSSTARMVAERIRADRGATSCRLGELRDMGLVSEVRTARCPISRMEVIWYGVGDGSKLERVEADQACPIRLTDAERRAVAVLIGHTDHIGWSLARSILDQTQIATLMGKLNLGNGA